MKNIFRVIRFARGIRRHYGYDWRYCFYRAFRLSAELSQCARSIRTCYLSGRRHGFSALCNDFVNGWQ